MRAESKMKTETVDTSEFPRLVFVDIDFSNGVEVKRLVDYLPLQVIADKLLISRVESETRSKSSSGGGVGVGWNY